MATRRELWTRLAAVSVTTAQLAAGLGTASPASAGPNPAVAAPGAGVSGTVRVGNLDLRPCGIVKGALCGRLAQPWDPSGGVRGNVSVGFAFLPTSDHSQPALGTYVPHEGGPATASRAAGPGTQPCTGRCWRGTTCCWSTSGGPARPRPSTARRWSSSPARTPRPQRSVRASSGIAPTCTAAPRPRTTSPGSISAFGLGPVDLYGDSYGTFFAQVFAGRRSDQLRSVVLDSAYPTTGETAWYPTQTPAMTSSFEKVRARTPACAALGGPTTPELLSQVLDQVRRKPYEGTGFDAEGVRHHVVVDGKALVSVAFGATYGPAWYRELGGALRSARRPAATTTRSCTT